MLYYSVKYLDHPKSARKLTDHPNLIKLSRPKKKPFLAMNLVQKFPIWKKTFSPKGGN